jgi:hypothetical protein
MAAGQLETQHGYGLNLAQLKMPRDCGAFCFQQ